MIGRPFCPVGLDAIIGRSGDGPPRSGRRRGDDQGHLYFLTTRHFMHFAPPLVGCWDAHRADNEGDLEICARSAAKLTSLSEDWGAVDTRLESKVPSLARYGMPMMTLVRVHEHNREAQFLMVPKKRFKWRCSLPAIPDSTQVAMIGSRILGGGSLAI